MKASFHLSGLDCADCASKIEHDVAALPGVANASVNFMMAKLKIEADESAMLGIVEAAAGIVRKYEPEVVMKRV